MKLTTKNFKKFLKQLSIQPCKEGMKALNKLLRQKKSMEYVFNKMLNMRATVAQISYAQWAYDRLRWGQHPDAPGCATFQRFKQLFNELPEIK